jgi:hypothetical protein
MSESWDRVWGIAGCTLDRKSMPMVAWYVLSNESYMKRVMRDVLPTVALRVSTLLYSTEHLFKAMGMRTALFTQEDQSVQYHQHPSPTHAQSRQTHLNFLSGFEYPDCAIVSTNALFNLRN